MSNGLLISRARKLQLQKISITTPSLSNLNAYKLFRNTYNKTLRAGKKLFLSKKLTENAKNPKKTWQTLRDLIPSNAKNSSIDKLKIGSKIVQDQCIIANEFITFFTEIGTKISNSIKQVKKKPEDYIFYDHDILPLVLDNICPQNVIDVLKSMDPKTSPDLDGLSMKLLKYIKAEISVPLAHIFNLSLTQGYFPSKLKCCRTVPIFKSGDPLLCDNYRPISLLSNISKILEKMVSIKLVNHLDNNKLLSKYQFGFQKGKSTEHNLMHLVNYVSTELNKGNYCLGIFLDLKKAFDVVSHKILLKKLSKMGINGAALNWFKSYLKGRSQKVDINGNLSDAKNLDISVIQGSILGPILFLCFINDLSSASDLFKLMFADDTSCLTAGPKLPELIEYANFEMQKVANWFRANKMAINTSKTKVVIFHTKGKSMDSKGRVLIFNENEIGSQNVPELISPIERVANYKILGVTIDENLSFDTHVLTVNSKIAKSLYCIRKVKNLLPLKAMRTLYFAMIHPHLLYCLNIFSCTTAKNLDKIAKKQKQAIRCITNSTYNAHTAPLFAKLEILPLTELVKFEKAKFMFKYVNNMLPDSFNEMWKSNHHLNENRPLRNANDLNIPAHSYETVKKLPLFSLPKLWNDLENEKHITNFTTFKICVKGNLMSSLHDNQTNA